MLRATFILILFFGFTLPLMPLQGLFVKLGLPWRRTFPHWYHKNVCRLIGVKIHQVGELALDQPSFIVSNHISWLDITVLSAVGPVSFVAKKEVASWPFFGWLAKLQRTVFVDRERRTKLHGTTNEIADRLNAGDHVVLFAEGTSNNGNEVLPFKTSLFAAVKPGKKVKRTQSRNIEAGLEQEKRMPDELVQDELAQDQVNVQTLALAYTHIQGLPMGLRGRSAVAWYGDMELASHIWGLLRRGPIDAYIHISPAKKLSSFADRKELAAYSEQQIRRDVMASLRDPKRAHAERQAMRAQTA